MKYVAKYENFYTDIDIKTGLYRKVIDPRYLRLASQAFEKDKFKSLISELFLNKKVNFFSNSHDSRIGIQVKKLEFVDEGAAFEKYFGRRILLIGTRYHTGSNKTERYILRLDDNFFIFIYSDVPFNISSEEKDLINIVKYNL